MRAARATLAAAVGASLAVTAGLTGCSLLQDRVCTDDLVPVWSLTDRYGGDCVRPGEPAPDGYALYPPGRVPEVIGDEHDRWPLARNYPWADEVPPDVRRAAAWLEREPSERR